MTYDVPLFPTKTYPIFEASTQSPKRKLKDVTWVYGAKPCKTLRKAAGVWTETTR